MLIRMHAIGKLHAHVLLDRDGWEILQYTHERKQDVQRMTELALLLPELETQEYLSQYA